MLVEKGQGEHIVYLPQPVAAVDALLQLQRVVGQVVVDHKGSLFQVEPPGAVVGGDEHFTVLFELLYGGVIRTAAVQHRLILAFQQWEKHILRLYALGKDHRFQCSAPLLHGGETQLEGIQQLDCFGVPLHLQRGALHLPPLGQLPGGARHTLQPFDNAPDGLQHSGGGGALQSQQPQSQVVGVHLREGPLHRLIDIGVQQVIKRLLLG